MKTDRVARIRQEAASAAAAVPYRVWLGLILLAAFALRAVGLGASDLVVDEAVSVFISAKAPREILTYCLSSIWEHPPGYYLLLHGWMRLTGDGEFALRYLSALGGVLAVALVAGLARRWFGRGAGLWVGLLMAISPMAVDYARNARMYSWLMALSLAAAYLFDRAMADRATAGRAATALEEGATPKEGAEGPPLRRATGENRGARDWALFLLTLLAALATHYLVGLVVLAYAIFLVVRWPRLPAGRTGLAVTLAILLAGAVGFMLAAPGPRQSLLEMLAARLSAPNELKALQPIYTHWPLGISGESIEPALSFPLSAFWWLMGAAGVAAMPKPRHWSRPNLQWLLALLIVVPPLAQWTIFPGKVLFPGISARHTSATVGLFLMAAGLGAVALWRGKRALGGVTGAALLGVALVISAREAANTDRSFSALLNFAGERAKAGEVYVDTYPFDWPQSFYYDRFRLNHAEIPQALDGFTQEQADARVATVLAASPSAWVSVYVGLPSTERVEQAFYRLGYPAQRQWFPGIRGLVHYYAALPLVERPGGMTWDGPGIRLVRWRASGTDVEQGDALRLEFDWQRTRANPPFGFISLKLAGPDGQAWAGRLGGPCSDRCPTTGWSDMLVTDRQAFEIPADVPPGDYELRVGWVSEDGAVFQGRETAGAPEQVDVALGKIHVAPASGGPRGAAGLDARLNAGIGGGVMLRGVTLPGEPVAAGARLSLPVQFQAGAAGAAYDLHLLIARDGREEHVTQPAGPAWYPSESWAPHSIVRSLPKFQLPGTLKPGVYTVSLGLSRQGAPDLLGRAAIGELAVKDRPRQYETRQVGDTVDARWAEGTRLARVEAPTAARPGETIPIKLIWQAGGPASRNWKIYVHLVGPDGEVAGQGDGYPAGGAALMPSWGEREVITDVHEVQLPEGLAAGKYHVRVGFYDEETGERLPMAGGGDSYILPSSIAVTRGGAP